MSYLLEDMEKWAGDRETVRLDREELNRKIDMRKHMLWHDDRDIKAGMMPPKEKIKPKFQTIKKGQFTSFAEDSNYMDKYLEKSQGRRRQREDFIVEKTRKINQAKNDAWEKEREALRASYERDLKKEKKNQLIKPIALAGTGASAIGGGAYLYHRYKKKKRAEAEQEKTAAPMFGKGRYIPRNESDDRGRAYDRLAEHERKKDNHDPSYNRKSHQEDIEAYDKATQAFNDMVERNKQTKAFRRKHITIPTATSAMIAADALKEKAEGDRSSAKMLGLTAGLVGAYPAFQGARIGIKELKNRYHWSKQENIDKDWAEREKDQDVYDRAYKPWFASRGNERLGK